VFVPYFARDEQGSGNGPASQEPIYNDDYLSNMSIPGNLTARHSNGTRYIGAAVLTPHHGPNRNCLSTPIEPSHQPQSQDPDAIDAMVVGAITVDPEHLFAAGVISRRGHHSPRARCTGAR
jgi:hypothetical protein